MPPIFATVDLETTGLDPQRDAIIEIGIVLFQGDQILEEWSSLINPRRRVPPNITALTGICQEEVDDAPSLLQVRPEIEQRINSRTLVAHNAPFDLGFLAQNNLARSSPARDTLELATILLPGAGHYSLSALRQSLALPDHPTLDAHRALADALATTHLYLELQARGRQLPFEILEEIVLAGRGIQWPHTPFFEEALAELSRTAFSSAPPRRREHKPLFRGSRERVLPLRPVEPPIPIDAEAVAALLDQDGLISQHFCQL